MEVIAPEIHLSSMTEFEEDGERKDRKEYAGKKEHDATYASDYKILMQEVIVEGAKKKKKIVF